MKAWIVFGMSVFLLAPSSTPQDLKRRDQKEDWCGPVRLRIAAKLRDGSAADLAPTELRIEFDRGVSTVVSARSFATLDGDEGSTDILFVIAPHSEFGATTEIHGIVNTLARAEGFHFRAAVLGPDGDASSYSEEPGKLDEKLRAAVESRHWVREMRRWVLAEESAFLVLRHQPGRHVIVRLFRGDGLHSLVQRNFLMDGSMEKFAATDLTMIYRLLAPVNLALSIPEGDAAGTMDQSALSRLPDANIVGQDSEAGRQRLQIEVASQAQANLWARQSYWGTQTAGGAASDTVTLMQKMIADHRAGYEVIVQPHFACRDAGLHAVRVMTTKNDVMVFGPQLVQLVSIEPSR